MAPSRQTPPTGRTPKTGDDKSHAGYAESSTEREALGQGDSKPRDRGEVRIDGQDPGYGSRARDSDDAPSKDAADSSEFGGRRTADDHTAATDEDDSTRPTEQGADKARGSETGAGSRQPAHSPATGAGKRR